MKKKNNRNLIEGQVRTVLMNLTIPMIFGMVGIVAFNLADTYFIGKLGTVQMAALTFTFPVVLIINSINHGLGIGSSAVIARAVGEKNQEKVKRLATDSLTLGLFFAIIAMIIGELTINSLFALLGADENIMPYIFKYMRIWYAGVPFVVIPMVGNSAIRALGDTKTPSIVMMVSATTNIILDPIFIFGFGIIPGFGVAGAAIGTVIARAITFCFAMYVLVIREKVVVLKLVSIKTFLNSWKSILFIGVPNAISKMIIPLGTGIITGIFAKFGNEAVAGYGIATRIEFLSLATLMALGSIIPVFVGQNFGANKIDRIKEGIWLSEKFSVLFGLFLYIFLLVFARPISYIFTQNKAVSDVVVLYMKIVPLGYGFKGLLQVISGAFNGMHKPIKGALINLLQMILIAVPLSIIISKNFGVKGILIALLASYFLVGIPSHFLFHKNVKKF